MLSALNGIKVLDLTHVLAGPFCTYQLGLMGADVIKVEDPENPDCARGRGPDDALNAVGLGLTYQVQGANKRSLALNLKTPQGAEVLRTLVKSADILVENYTTGALENLGLGYDVLTKINPCLIHCSITGYGDSGPQARHGAYDNVIQATSGTILQCGGIKPGVSFVDYATGYAAAFAISAGLIQRAQTGRGTHMSVSMLEVALQMMAPEAAGAQHPAPVARGKEAGIASYDTRDGRLMLGAFRPAQYRKLAVLLEDLGHPLPALAQVKDWPDVWALSEEVKANLRDIFLTKDADTWVTHLRACDLPAERVKSLSEAVTLPQIAARGYFQPNPIDPVTHLPTTAFHMDNTGASVTKAPPTLGEHTQDVLTELGLDADQIGKLMEAGIVK
ncbi:CaiB/BaiF CoA transferase family protein [Poseidonocella sedimentorum]|uniref:Crotonobetainyl-CoA:carnitine CoA-transferase CaiB n=1 Tax=Poseidonocella sedimentorum TaxID=871652 RepID=A0A1I6E683_9RHOB|nr:CoA transferase [Poseidonocella sedimentorum]SFR13245.1 Crotonobetainyl-CoA:carnitine CoA-transferase CaiB [Poseidonocella sedimentorum]